MIKTTRLCQKWEKLELDQIRGRCGAIFRKWKTLKTQHCKFRAVAKTFDGRDEQSHLPKSAISKFIMEDLVMTKNKIQQVPLQAKKPINVEHPNFYLDQVKATCRQRQSISLTNSKVVSWKLQSTVVMEMYRSENQHMKFRDTAYETLILPSTFSRRR